MTPDALVLGAGPAGAAASIALRRLGASVVLADPHLRAPRRPRHTESVHPGLEPLLAHLGVVDCLLAATRGRYRGVWVEWGTGRRFQPLGGDDWRGFHVSRTELDASLAGAAEALGAQVLVEAPREALCDGDRVEAIDFASCRMRPRVVIDCTGANRWLGRRVRAGYQTQSRRLFADYGFAIGAASDELPLIRASGEEWYWLAEVGDDRLHWTRVRTDHQKRAQPPAELAQCEVESRGATEVTWYTAAQVAGPGWILCGDAAARIDPVIGGGVLRGIAGAMHAVHAWVTGDPDAYQQWHHARVQSDMTAVTELYGAVGLSDWMRAAEGVSGRGA